MYSVGEPNEKKKKEEKKHPVFEQLLKRYSHNKKITKKLALKTCDNIIKLQDRNL